jgi:hypothetical protein
MTEIAASDLIVPVGVGLVALWAISRINAGPPTEQKQYDMDTMVAGVNGNLARWQDMVSHGHYVPLQYEADAPEVNDRLEYLKTDWKGDPVTLGDETHAYSTGWHPGLTQVNGQDVTLRMVNDNKKAIARTKPGYAKRVSRSAAIGGR